MDLKSEVWLRCTSRLESITDLKWPLSMHINLGKSEMNTFSNIAQELIKIGSVNTYFRE